MRSLCIAILIVIGASGCAGDDVVPPEESVQMTTLENAPRELRPIEDPPRIEFDESPASSTTESGSSSESPTPTGLAELPFTPKIAMDPIDGSKLSIRRDTPVVEYDGRIYYFTTEAHRLEFIKNPEEYLSGAFASY